MKLIRPIIFLGSAILLTIATTAAARTKKSLPGMACMESGGNQQGAKLSYSSSNGAVRAMHTTGTINLRCPIMRETPDDTSIVNIFARVENNSGDPITCFVRSCTPDGATCSNSPPSLPASPTCNPHSTCMVALSSTTGYTNGYAYLECPMPAVESGQSSAIVYYRWED